uniref:RNA-binding protein 25 n=1 Tax=Gouania willdenowi TaxID=441366 RepID=A0A8C5DGG6_GOUWI
MSFFVFSPSRYSRYAHPHAHGENQPRLHDTLSIRMCACEMLLPCTRFSVVEELKNAVNCEMFFQVLVPTTVAVIQKPMIPKREPLHYRANDADDSGPTTTVFVGNISEKASDMLIRQLLAKCGIVLSWKRVQGASGKLQAFGFCEYKEPESTLRALRLLHELLLGDKKLLVKVDSKTKTQLDEWKAKKRSTDSSKNEDDDEEEVLDDETLNRDQLAKGSIEVLMREYASELNASSQDPDGQSRNKRRREKKEEVIFDINAMELEDDKRDLISREINKFRDTHKKLEEEKGKKEKERQELEKERKERDKERERERERRDREKEKERERERDKERERDRDRDRQRERERERTKEREREREKDRSRDASEDRNSRSRSVECYLDTTREDRKRDREEDEEDLYERKKLERRLRDKEAAYQERLKNWEIRERKKCRDYSKDAEREDERRREMAKEAKRLKEFLEDYDDERDDLKYYRGSALQKRLRDREKEADLDERDRKREKEELEEIRKRLLAEGHPDPDAELQRMEEEAERRRQPPLKLKPDDNVIQETKKHRNQEKKMSDAEDSQEAPPQLKPMMRPICIAPAVSSASGNSSPNTPDNKSPSGIIIPEENIPESQPLEEHRPKIGLSLKLGATNSPSQLNTGKRKKLATLESVFNKFEEETDEQPPKRKLVPLDYGDDDKSLGLDGAELPGTKGSVNTEEKRKHIKSLIEKIPTAREELFSYELDWAMVDSTLMDRRIKPWINKKIIEYIGEEEATLVDFVCSKVMAHSTPQGILDDVAMVLDEEAEVFIVKMWRLLIYETESKKIGLVK